MKKEHNEDRNIDRSNWVINLSKKPLTNAERLLLEKGPKFAITPASIPYKNIVSEVEAIVFQLIYYFIGRGQWEMETIKRDSEGEMGLG